MIEFYLTVILQKESMETVYTSLRKVGRGPRASPSKMDPKHRIYYRKSYSKSFWVVFTNINFPKIKKKLVNCFFVALNFVRMLVVGL